MKVTGKLVEDLRKKLTIAQGALAKDSGIHQTTLSRIESASDKPLSDDHWNRLRDALFNLGVKGLDLADRSRETDEQIFVRKGDDGSVTIVSLGQRDEPAPPPGRVEPAGQPEPGWIPFACRLAGDEPFATMKLRSSLTGIELKALKKWLDKVRAAAEAFTDVDPLDRGNG